MKASLITGTAILILGSSCTQDDLFESRPVIHEDPHADDSTLLTSKGTPVAPYIVPLGKSLKFNVTPLAQDSRVKLLNSLQKTKIDSHGDFEWTPTESEVGSHLLSFDIERRGEKSRKHIYVHVESSGLSPLLESARKANSSSLLSEDSNNRPPELINFKSKFKVKENETLSFQAQAKDPDDNPLFFSIWDLPRGARYDYRTNKFTWKPGFQDAGSYIVTLTVSDGNLSVQEKITIEVEDVNRPPKLSTKKIYLDAQQGQQEFALDMEDPDGNPLKYSIVKGPSWISLKNGIFIAIPSKEHLYSSFPLTVKVSDGTHELEKELLIKVEQNLLSWTKEFPSGSFYRFSPIIQHVSAAHKNSDAHISYRVISDDSACIGVNQPTMTRNGNFSWTPSEIQSCTLQVDAFEYYLDPNTTTLTEINYSKPKELTTIRSEFFIEINEDGYVTPAFQLALDLDADYWDDMSVKVLSPQGTMVEVHTDDFEGRSQRVLPKDLKAKYAKTFESLEGEPLKGTWTVIIRSRYKVAKGKLFSWGIQDRSAHIQRKISSSVELNILDDLPSSWDGYSSQGLGLWQVIEK